MIGRYRIDRKIGSGGMADVFLAFDTAAGATERRVAIKRMREEFALDPRHRRMLVDEARLASRIDHPNVAKVFEAHDGAQAPYIVMEYLEGRALSELIARAKSEGAVDIDRMCKIVVHAADGAHAAHELRGTDGRPLEMVHRDLTPQNIFVTFEGGVKLLDFGIAKTVMGRSGAETSPGIRRGKVAYMTPEQMRGETLDRRADVYTLGLVLYEATTGQSVFNATDNLGARILGLKVEAPSSREPGYPRALEAIVLRALEPRREDRYPTAREMGEALERFLAARGAHIGPADIARMMGRLFSGAA